MMNVVFYVRDPLAVYFYSAVLWVLIWIIAPIDFILVGGLSSVLYLIGIQFIFAIGLFLGHRRLGTSKCSIDLEVSRVINLYRLVMIIGVFGLTVRTVERFYMRGGGALTLNFIGNRELLVEGGSGPLALVGGVLAGFLIFVPFFYFMLKSAGQNTRSHKLLFFISFLFPLSDVLLQGSRSTLILFAGVLVASWLAFNSFKPRMTSIIAAIFLGLGLLLSVGWIFAIRTSQMGQDPVASMYLSGYANFAPAAQWVISYLETNGVQGLGMVFYTFVHVSQYFLHGVYEFFYIISEVSLPTTYGLNSFYIPIKIFNTLVGAVDVERVLEEGHLRPGVFTTLFGPLVYDFGAVGALFASFFIGFGVGWIGRKVRLATNLKYFPLYLLIIGILPFALMVNLFVGGGGQYALISGLLLMLISRSVFRAC